MSFYIDNGKPVMEIPKRTPDELRKLVTDILGNLYFVSEQVREQDLLGMIFMPLALGGLNPPEDVIQQFVGDIPEQKDFVPGEPPVPEALPKAPCEIPPDVILVEISPEIERSYKFGDMDEETYRQEVASVDSQNEKLKRDHAKALAVVESSVKAWKKECSQIKARNKKALSDYSDSENLRRQESDREDEKIEFLDAWQGEIFSIWYRDVGVLGAPMSSAGPRSINGYPMFMSMEVIHREDWTRVRAALVREQERMKNFEV